MTRSTPFISLPPLIVITTQSGITTTCAIVVDTKPFSVLKLESTLSLLIPKFGVAPNNPKKKYLLEMNTHNLFYKNENLCRFFFGTVRLALTADKNGFADKQFSIS